MKNGKMRKDDEYKMEKMLLKSKKKTIESIWTTEIKVKKTSTALNRLINLVKKYEELS